MHPQDRFSFASDNYSGVHPTILQAIYDANGGHQNAYGDDNYSHALDALIQHHFGKHATCYPVFNGTGANLIGLQAILPRFGAVLCTQNAHIYRDENIAPEYIAGTRCVVMPSDDGKLNPQLIPQFLSDGEHNAQVKAVYISQVTELGTCYTLDEMRAISDVCKNLGLKFYIDGARLSNAIAHLGCTLGDIASTGADIVSFGGTKNGLMIGELLVVLNPEIDPSIKHLRKINLQLGSKLRFISAQFVAWLQDELWLKLARHSNDVATYLYHQLKDLEGVTITQPVQSNAVFAILPSHVIKPLQDKFHFYTWNDSTGEVRLMASFDSTYKQVDDLVATLKTLMS